MNRLPEPMVLNGEVMPPGDTISVLVNRHPFSNSPTKYNVAIGASLQDMLEECFPLHGTTPLVCYLVNDRHEDVIPSEWWPRIRPKIGTLVVFRAVAEGKYAKALAMIAVAVLAITAAFFLGPAGFGLVGSLGAQLIAGGITIAGSLAVQALFPTPKKKLENTATEEAANVFSIQGAQNQARPFEAVPVVLGTHKISPPYAGQPFTEFVGNDQFLTVVFCPGYGPMGHADMKIGETPISAFTFDKFESYAGWPNEPNISFYPSDVHQEDFSIKLLNAVSNIRTTEGDVDLISVDLQAPEGIYQFFPDTGIRGNLYVTFSVYYAVHGSGNYQLLYGSLNPFSYGLNALRFGFSWAVPRGQYDVMITRNFPDSTDSINTKDAVFWTAMRSTTFEAPVHFDVPLSLIGMKIKATDQLSGVVDTFNLVASGVSWAFNGSSWGTNYTSNPADLFRQVLQGPANKMPVPDSRLDFPTIQNWWAFCITHGFTYNAVVESKRSVYEIISEICAAGRAVPTWKDGKWSVIWDDFSSPIVQHFTPRNSRDFKSDRVYRRMPHGFRIRFVNALEGYVEDEMIVYDDGYYPGNATLFEAIEFPGVTDPGLIYKHGRYHIAQARLRPELYTLTVDIENLRCTRGDRVRVQHDVALIGQVSGRCVSSDYNTKYAVLDETITMEAGKQYGLRWRDSTGGSNYKAAIHREGEWNDIYFEIAGNVPLPGDLVMFGERDLETAVFRVFKIEHQTDFEARITLVDDAPEIINADTGPIPEFDPHTSEPVDPYALPPRNLTVTEIVQGTGDQSSAFVRFSWTPARAAHIVAYETQIRDQTHLENGWYGTQVVQAPQQYADFNVVLGTYSFRVRAKFDDGTVSSWSTLESFQITQRHLTSTLPDIVNVRTAYVDGVTIIRWDEVVDFRPIKYEIRRGDTWDAALLMGTFAQPPFVAHGLGTYWIAAVTRPVATVTIYSPHPTPVTIGGSRLFDNVVAVWDERATGWSGIFSGSVAISGTAIRTAGSTPFLAEPDFLGIPSLFESGGIGNGNYYMPDSHTIDCGHIVRAAVTMDYDGTGDAVAQGSGPVTTQLFDSDGNEILDSDGNQVFATTSPTGGPGSLPHDFLSRPDFLADPDFLGASSARFVEIYPLIGTKNFPGDAWTWERWQPGVYVARYFTGAMVLRSKTQTVAAYCFYFTMTVDVPDRVDRLSNILINSLGTTLTFQPEGDTVPAAFHGGPNGSTTPNVQVTILDAVAGDTVVVSGLTVFGCTIKILNNAGVGVGRNCDIVIQGY